MSNKVNICFSWLTSCWKTSHANYIAERYGIPRISASDILIKEWRKNGLHAVEYAHLDHPWLGAFDDFNEKRIIDTKADEKIDRDIFEIMRTTNGVVVESLTLPFLTHRAGEERSSLLIYLHASHKNRVGRAFNSSPTMRIDDLDIWVKGKDAISQTIIGNIWQTDIQNMNEQFPYNDVVLDTNTIDNGDPYDVDNREYGKKITRSALTSIIDIKTWVRWDVCDTLKKISDAHPCLFKKLPENIWTAIQ